MADQQRTFFSGRLLRRPLAFFLALVLAACGGGEGGVASSDLAASPLTAEGALAKRIDPAREFNKGTTAERAAKIASSYRSRIGQSSGSISDRDLAAVTAFVTAAMDATYWDKLVDVGLIAGNELPAATVKLKSPRGSPSQAQNNGYSAADYSPDRGLALGAARSLNTRTNLANLDLQGRFGFSFWLAEQGTGWMGTANSSTPYSMLHVDPGFVASYIGGSGANGARASSSGVLYHAIKQSLSSTKLFVDGVQLGATNTTPTSAVLRNADVEVFREAGESGRGYFYAIDNGTLTDSEVARFHADVRQLMYALGREIAPPLISADGHYTTAQTVAITQAPTRSSTAGAAIHYTVDGSAPSTASPLYTAPLQLANSTRIRAIAAKNGKVSLEASAQVAIVPEGFTTQKYYTAHVMVNLLSFTPDMVAWVRSMKGAGYNLIWAHLDDYQGSYVSTLRSLMDAAATVGGIQVMAGPSWWVEPALVVNAYKDTWNHPALLKIGGKRVYAGWDYQPYKNQPAVDSLLVQAGFARDQYALWVHSRYPYSYDSGKTWVGEFMTDSGYLHWHGRSSADLEMNVDHLYDTRPVDGLINFAVDQGPIDSLITTNKVITAASLRRGKLSMGGISAFYASVSFMDLGFQGAAQMWDAVLAAPPQLRPNGMSDTTANDYAELSYMSPMVVPPTNGLSFIPPLSAGYNLGNNIRYPLTDHSGIQAFLRPWVDAYLQNKAAPSFAQDRMFSWYWLHPQDAAPTPTIPAMFSGYPHLNQTWWNSQVYATGSIAIGGGYQVDGLKIHNRNMGKIRMAAHLSAPAQLKINGTLSEPKRAGPAYFEIEMGSFRGTPSFALVRDGVTVTTADGLQPITDSVFPGGWNFLATEVR